MPGDDARPSTRVAADVDLSASRRWALDGSPRPRRAAGRTARVHLKVDTGLGRGGADAADWPALRRRRAGAQAEGAVEVVGVWSHLAYADAPDHPTIDRQLEALRRGAGGRRAGRRPARGAAPRQLRGDADPPGDALRPGPPGIAVYGLSPVPDWAARATSGCGRR